VRIRARQPPTPLPQQPQRSLVFFRLLSLAVRSLVELSTRPPPPSHLHLFVGSIGPDIAFSNSRPNDLLIAYSPVGTSTTPNRGFRHTEAKAGGAGPDGAEAADGVGVEAGLRTLAAGGLLCLWDLNDTAAPRM
jgi:hypothetical protein